MTSKALHFLEVASGRSFRVLEVTGGLALLVMMLVTTLDVTGRYFFGQSIRGSVELTQLLLATVIFLALPNLHWLDEHINVDLVPLVAPKGWGWVQHALIHLIAVAALIAVLPKIVTLAGRAASYGDATEFLRIPMHYPMKMMVAMVALSILALAARLVLIVSRRALPQTTSDKDH